jgi:hypothetical protein
MYSHAREEMTRLYIYRYNIHAYVHVPMNSQAREELTRWGAYTSKNMLDDYKVVYEKLIAAMGRGASVEECIATIESA